VAERSHFRAAIVVALVCVATALLGARRRPPPDILQPPANESVETSTVYVQAEVADNQSFEVQLRVDQQDPPEIETDLFTLFEDPSGARRVYHANVPVPPGTHDVRVVHLGDGKVSELVPFSRVTGATTELGALTGTEAGTSGQVMSQDLGGAVSAAGQTHFVFGETEITSGPTYPGTYASSTDPDPTDGITLAYFAEPVSIDAAITLAPPASGNTEDAVRLRTPFVRGSDLLSFYERIDGESSDPVSGLGLAVAPAGALPFTRLTFPGAQPPAGGHFDDDFSLFQAGELFPVSGGVALGNFLHLFGLRPPVGQETEPNYVFAARVPLASVEDRSAYEYWTDVGGVLDWRPDPAGVVDLWANSSAPSVAFNPFLARFVSIHAIEDGTVEPYATTDVRSIVALRTADALTGPWSGPLVLWERPQTIPLGPGSAFDPVYLSGYDDGHLLYFAANDGGEWTRSLNAYLFEVDLGALALPPTIEVTAPPANGFVNTAQVTVTGEAPSATSLTVEGVAANLAGGAFTADVTLAEGANVLDVVATNAVGTTEVAHPVTLDTGLPVVTITAPADASVVTTPSVQVTGTVSDASPLTSLVVAGVAQTPGTSFSVSVPLDLGRNLISVQATDAAGNVGTASVTVTLELVVAIASPTDGALIEAAAADVSGSVNVAGASVTVNGVEAAVVGTSFSRLAVPLAQVGSNHVSATASSGADNATQQITVVRLDSPPPPPGPDPTPDATTVPGTVPADLDASIAFLYEDATPVQTGVTPSEFDPRRIAVLRGQVLSRGGVGIAGVGVRVGDHPEHGETLTRGDGMFDLAVNGGGLLTVVYEHPSYLPVRRKIEVPWRDYTWLPDVVLIPPDPAQTVVSLPAPPNPPTSAFQVVQGSLVTDGLGTRRSTLLVPPGTTATSGGQHEESLTVRVTEYTVGSSAEAAVPLPVPPGADPTYLVEWTAEEAPAGVSFNQRVFWYVENFTGYHVGTVLPNASLDVAKGAWLEEPHGRVLRIVGETDGAADLDLDGNTGADPGLYATFGITLEERQQLASLYEPSQELWRIPLEHFSCPGHFVVALANDVIVPPVPRGQPREPGACSTCSGSILHVERQVLGEVVEIVGTPYRLHYRSDRVPGYEAAATLDIPVSGADPLPASLVRIDLEVRVAGRRTRESFPPEPNQTHTFTWDGTDAYGRALQGRQRVTAKVTYRYAPVNLLDEDGNPAAVAFKGRGLQGRTTVWRGFIGRWDAFSASGLGGWSLSAHHAYDPFSQVLHRGDGGQMRAEDVPARIETVAGTSVAGQGGDGLPAIDTRVDDPLSVAAAPDGSFYIGQLRDGGFGPSRVWRVDPEGIIHRIVGSGAIEDDPDQDGGPAFSAKINAPRGIAIAPDGSVYIATGGHRVRRVDPNGIITTVAGTGTAGFLGDGGPAVDARLHTPEGVAVGPDGALYIADAGNGRVRRVGPDGRISTFAGGAGGGFPTGDGGPATEANIGAVDGLAFDPDGGLYLSTYSQDLIWRVDPDGIIHIVAGDDSCPGESCGDGGPAFDAGINNPRGIAFGPDGSLYVTEQLGERIRRIDPDGIISTVAGVVGQDGFAGDGGPATAASLRQPDDVAVAPDGSLLVADMNNGRVRRVQPPLPGITVGNVLVPSEDGSELYEFDATGLHLRTLDGATEAELLEFGYDPESGLLETITDGDGNVTTIVRDASGDPTGIDPPFAGNTQLGLDANGYLDGITNPAGESYAMVNTADGLLDTLTTPAGHIFDFVYELDGRLLVDVDPEGGSQTLSRSEAAVSVPPIGGGNPRNGTEFRVSRTTALGRVSEFAVQDLANGTLRRETVDAAGFVTAREINRAGTETTEVPDGTHTTVELGSDPRLNLGLLAAFPASLTITTPGGRSFERTQTRVLTAEGTGATPADHAQTDTVSINNKPAWVTTSEIVGIQRIIETTSPEGRVQTTKLDARGRVVEAGVAGIEPVRFAYDPQGRLATLAQGPVGQPAEQITTFRYDAQGFLGQIEDPEGRIVDMTRDLAGRMDLQTLPFVSPTPPHDPPGGTEVIDFAYDPNGNVSAITPPGRPAHELFYTKLDQEEEYRPPVLLPEIPSPQTLFAYDLDRALDLVTRPDAKQIDPAYDTAGRLDTLMLLDDLGAPEVALAYGYDPGTGNLSTITRCDAPAGGGGCAGTLEGLALAYDGALPTMTTWTGTVEGSVTHGYDDDLRISTEQVSGEAPIAFQYDDDNLLTGAGALSLVPHPQHGLLATTALGAVTTSQSYTAFGELDQFSATGPSGTLYTLDVEERDELGRITRLTETLEGGSARTLDYEYDLAGRLFRVSEGVAPAVPVAVREYTYDANGNRLSVAVGNPTPIAAYDAQDRLTGYAGASYTYTANGELETKTEGGQTTTYAYDLLGNLTRVELPDATVIEYVIDGLGRRIGRKVDGVLEAAWLYGDALEPVAELGGTGAIVSRFVYGSKPNVPDYMVKGGVTYRILSDHLGSVRLVVDATTGAVAQRIDYDEFGKVLADTTPEFQPFGFAGGLYDPDTGLVRFGARDYDAEIGRWTAKDPIRFAGGANLYDYTLNDPVNRVDLRGEIPALIAVPLAGAAIGGAFGFAAQVALNAANGCSLLSGSLAAIGAGAAAGGIAAGAGFVAGSILGGGGATAYAAGISGLAGLAAAKTTGSNPSVTAGVAVGAAVGSAIVPGPGTVVGAVSGATVSSTLAFTGALIGGTASGFGPAACGCAQ
jgi:RHS repeat-associated protein